MSCCSSLFSPLLCSCTPSSEIDNAKKMEILVNNDPLWKAVKSPEASFRDVWSAWAGRLESDPKVGLEEREPKKELMQYPAPEGSNLLTYAVLHFKSPPRRYPPLESPRSSKGGGPPSAPRDVSFAFSAGAAATVPPLDVARASTATDGEAAADASRPLAADSKEDAVEGGASAADLRGGAVDTAAPTADADDATPKNFERMARFFEFVREKLGASSSSPPFLSDSDVRLVELLDSTQIQKATWMLWRFPDLVTSAYGKGLYEGENLLHMAIAKRDLELVRWVMEVAVAVHEFSPYAVPSSLSDVEKRQKTDSNRERLLNNHAVGGFFKHPSEKGTIYIGELPLSLAATLGQATIIHYLLENYAPEIHLGKGDVHGNTAGHLAAYHGQFEIYELLQAFWTEGLGRPTSWSLPPTDTKGSLKTQEPIESGGDHGVSFDLIVNNDGCAPLVLAAKRGHKDMFHKMWLKMSSVRWMWGGKTSRLLKLELIDFTPRARPMEAHAVHAYLRRATPVRDDADDGGVDSDSPRSARGGGQRPRKSGVFLPAQLLPAADTAPAGGSVLLCDISSCCACLRSIGCCHRPKAQRFAARAMTRAMTTNLTPQPADTLGGAKPAPVVVHNITSVMDAICEDSLEDIIDDKYVLGLLDKKWDAFGFRFFVVVILLEAVFLALFMSMAIIRASTPEERIAFHCVPSSRSAETSCTTVIALEVIVAIVTGLRLTLVLWNNIFRPKVVARTKGAMLFKAWLAVVRDLGIVGAFCAEAGAGALVSRFVWSPAGILAWGHAIFALLVSETTGTFVVILSEVIVKDLWPIVLMFAFLYGGFMQTFVALSSSGDFQGETGAGLAEVLVRTLLYWVFAAEVTPDGSGDRADGVFFAWSFLYHVVVTIILISLLVARFNATFQRISDKSRTRWNLERCRIMLDIEDHLPEAFITLSALKYWVDPDSHPTFIVVEGDDAAESDPAEQREKEFASKFVNSHHPARWARKKREAQAFVNAQQSAANISAAGDYDDDKKASATTLAVPTAVTVISASTFPPSPLQRSSSLSGQRLMQAKGESPSPSPLQRSSSLFSLPFSPSHAKERL